MSKRESRLNQVHQFRVFQRPLPTRNGVHGLVVVIRLGQIWGDGMGSSQEYPTPRNMATLYPNLLLPIAS
jgi:hypothetical protein